MAKQSCYYKKEATIKNIMLLLLFSAKFLIKEFFLFFFIFQKDKNALPETRGIKSFSKHRGTLWEKEYAVFTGKGLE